MATAIQWRRGNTSQHANFTGLSGEITVDTDLNTLIVHDGSTQGGYRLAKYSEISALGTGDITNVIAGSGLTGGSESGNATLALDYENLTGNLIPSANNTYSLGSLSNVWKDVYVGPGSLYVNGQKVLEDNAGTIQFSADINQNISILTTGLGDIEVLSGGDIQLKSNVVLSAGKVITVAGGGSIEQTSNINMNSNHINNLDNPINAQDAATKAYVDALDTDDISEGNNEYFTTARSNAAVDAHLSGGDGIDYASGVIDVDSTVVRTTGDQSIGGAKTFNEDVVLQGNLTVNGATVTVNTETLLLEDNIITLNYGTTGAAATDAGIQIDRGDDADVLIKWDETGNKWTFTNDGVNYKDIATSTTDLAEGTNLYYIDARVETKIDSYVTAGTGVSISAGAISATLAPFDTDDLAQGAANKYFATTLVDAHLNAGTGISYSTGTISATLAPFDTDDLAQGTANKYFATTLVDDHLTAGTGISYSTGTISASLAPFDTDDLAEGTNLYFTNDRVIAALTGADTDDIAEGTNLYYTDARARAAISATGSLSYNSTTGVISYTTPTTIASLSNHDTDDLAEGTNLYYTDARARAAISASGDISYNSATGVISFTNDAGDIEAVTAGLGLTGGGTAGSVSLAVGAGDGIDVAADAVAINTSYVRGLISASGDISYNSTTGVISFTNDAGDIESVAVTAGLGLTGGGSASSGAFSATLNIGAGTGISVAADSISVNMGAFDTGDLAEGTNLYYTVARANTAIDARIGTSSTSDLSEGTNLYYTVARANSAIDARVTTSYVNALNVNATTLDTLDSTAFLRSNAADSHSGTITPSTNNSINLGSATLKYANVYATTFQGQATSAQYADLAEKYTTDAELDAGTVVCFGGDAEVTACDHEADHRVAGVISTDPAYMMNSGADGQYVALTGRVPCKVTGPVAKGDLLVSSSVKGHAKADNNAAPGRIIGKAIGSSEGGETVIEVLVNMM